MNLMLPAASGSDALVLRSTRNFQPFGACASSGVTVRTASAAMRARRLSMDAILHSRAGARMITIRLWYVRWVAWVRWVELIRFVVRLMDALLSGSQTCPTYPTYPTYSARSASSGSIRDALSDGTRQASTPTT